MVEEETAKRIEDLVAQRVAEELERRKDEIEAEVLRRVEEAKATMEKEMMEELQRQKAAQLAEERRREVATTLCPLSLLLCPDSDRVTDRVTDRVRVRVDQSNNEIIQNVESSFLIFLREFCALLHYLRKFF